MSKKHIVLAELNRTQLLRPQQQATREERIISYMLEESRTHEPENWRLSANTAAKEQTQLE